MRLIESKVEYIPQDEGLEGIYRQIELAGRTAYHSQDKITSDSAKDFTERMIKSNHGAALEHGTVYLNIDSDIKHRYEYSDPIDYIGKCKYTDNSYSKCTPTYHKTWGVKMYDKTIYVTTNFRVLQENGWLDDLQYICSPTKFHEKRYTMRFTCSRAIAQELTRHRVFSFLMESQRYINYSKERHGGEITFIIPSWAKSYDNVSAFEAFQVACQDAEYDYLKLLNLGMQPQQARDVLPNATKTELVMTGFASDWKRLLDLRLFESTGKVHPDMKLLMEKLWTEAVNNDIWNGFNYCTNKTE